MTFIGVLGSMTLTRSNNVTNSMKVLDTLGELLCQ